MDEDGHEDQGVQPGGRGRPAGPAGPAPAKLDLISSEDDDGDDDELEGDGFFIKETKPAQAGDP